jgi:uncharacterized protein YjbI with pentapeptide repeats
MTAIAIIAVGYLPKANSFSGFQGKTLWDWLSLLVVPASLAALAAWLQHKQHERELKIAEDNRQEEALQHYLDRVSNLLIEKNLLAIAAKDTPTIEEKELLGVSAEIIRALTVSTLLRLSDKSRRNNMASFLLEADIIQRLGVSLEGANLRDANLSCIELKGVNLSWADLRQSDLSDSNFADANLYQANLRDANLDAINLKGAELSCSKLENAHFICANLTSVRLNDSNLSGANLAGANLTGANLTGADLTGADLSRAILGDADLSCAIGLTRKQLEKAYFCKTKLPKGIDIDCNRDCARLSEFYQLAEFYQFD